MHRACRRAKVAPEERNSQLVSTSGSELTSENDDDDDDDDHDDGDDGDDDDDDDDDGDDDDDDRDDDDDDDDEGPHRFMAAPKIIIIKAPIFKL